MEHSTMKKYRISWIVVFWLTARVYGQINELFNFDMSNRREYGRRSYGLRDWGDVSCSNIDTCSGYPNKYPHSVGWTLQDEGNNCRWCPEDNGNQPRPSCGLHRQSPIDLKRNRAIPGAAQEKECPDWHWMQYRDDTCDWEDMKDSFTIERHALQIHIPTLNNGEIACQAEDGKRQFPRLDYSKGFPDWWWLQRTDIYVPSQHTQEGTQYAAEVTLAHFYQIAHTKNQLGHVTIFMQDYPDAESWPFLDKLICAWREVEERVRSQCNLPPAPPYGRCRLFRNQQATEEWLFEAGFGNAKPTTRKPTKAPTRSPVQKPTKAPVQAPTDPPVQASRKPPPTKEPTPEPTPPAVFGEVGFGIPPPIDCNAYDINYGRMCHSGDPCCEGIRADTEYCWRVYDFMFPGSMVNSACYHCCPNEQKIIGPPKPDNPRIPRTMSCSSVINPVRMCRPNSCCSNPRPNTAYCRSVYREWGDKMQEICWYCCRESRKIGPPRRRLGSGGNTTMLASRAGGIITSAVAIGGEANESTSTSYDSVVSPASVSYLTHSNRGGEMSNESSIPFGAKVAYAEGKKFILRQENFEEDEDEDEYFRKIHADYQRRNLQGGVHEENYEDVEYWPYEWMLKVETEYYFRYEGTMPVPPCFEVVHWRVMKDPMRVHPRQIDELNRLLAWRISPSGRNQCQNETAGVKSPDGNRVALNRPTQYYHTQHRKVFCECKDWPSKFDADRQWCKNWKDDPGQKRFYEHPYSFDPNADWLPNI